MSVWIEKGWIKKTILVDGLSGKLDIIWDAD